MQLELTWYKMRNTGMQKNVPNFILFFFMNLRSNKVTPLEVVQRALKAIEDMDKREPKLRAFVQVNKDEVLKVCATLLNIFYWYCKFKTNVNA